eukprot:5131475-Pleurochrysis_carterae.AAC.1
MTSPTRSTYSYATITPTFRCPTPARGLESRLIIKFLPTALAGEGRALLRELIDKNQLGKESKVIEETVRLVKMAHTAVPVSAAVKGRHKKDKRAIAAATPSPFKGKPGGTQTSDDGCLHVPLAHVSKFLRGFTSSTLHTFL